MSFEDNAAAILAEAKRVHPTAKDWTVLWNAIYGNGGMVARTYPSRGDRERFLRSDVHTEILELVQALRTARGTPAAPSGGKILVRLPVSLHEALKQEAEVEGVSLNQLVVAKLACSLGSTVQAMPNVIGSVGSRTQRKVV